MLIEHQNESGVHSIFFSILAFYFIKNLFNLVKCIRMKSNNSIFLIITLFRHFFEIKSTKCPENYL